MLSRAVSPGRSAGFTLTELMIAVAVFATLITVGLPSFRQMLQNYQVRVAAESVANGLQRARAEAVARNAPVFFALASSSSSTWTVDYVTKPVSTDPPIDSRSSAEGSANVAVTAVASDLSTAATSITFNNLGQVTSPAATTLARVTFNASATGGNQTLRVVIGAGGNAKVCDPSLPTTNLRYCP